MNPSLARSSGIKSGEEDFDDYVIQTFSFENGKFLSYFIYQTRNNFNNYRFLI